MSAVNEVITAEGVSQRPRFFGSSGENVLLLHGQYGARQCEALARQLGGQARVCLPTHPGYDDLDRPEWLERIPDLAHYYFSLLEEMNWERVHVIGHDIGGWIAAEMAVRQCKVFNRMSLISPFGLHVEGSAPQDFFLLNDERFAQESVYQPDMAKRVFEGLGDDEALTVIRNREMTAKLGWQPRLHDWQLAKWLHRARVPAQVIWGENDAIQPVGVMAGWLDRLPDAAGVTIPACGHLPQIEQCDVLVKEVQQFANYQ